MEKTKSYIVTCRFNRAGDGKLCEKTDVSDNLTEATNTYNDFKEFALYMARNGKGVIKQTEIELSEYSRVYKVKREGDEYCQYNIELKCIEK